MTPRQQEIAELLALGAPTKIMMRKLGLSESTVKCHVAGVLRALGVQSRSAAISILAHGERHHREPGDKPLTVRRFSNGALGITCAGQALHLRPEEARELARRMVEEYPEYQSNRRSPL